jgi:hypothetical protein
MRITCSVRPGGGLLALTGADHHQGGIGAPTHAT